MFQKNPECFKKIQNVSKKFRTVQENSEYDLVLFFDH